MLKIDWSRLHDDHGPSTNLPDLIARLDPDVNSSEWRELWQRVYHQGSLYTASPHVLSLLLDVIADWHSEQQVVGLALAQAIVASDDFPPTGFDAEIDGLRRLAVRAADLPKLEMQDRIFVMMAVLTLGGDRVLGAALEGLGDDDEVHGACPSAT